MLFAPFSMILVAMKFFMMNKSMKVCLCLTNHIRQLLVQNRVIVTAALYFPSTQYTSSLKNYQSDIQKKLISDKPKHLKFHLKDCCIGSYLEMFRNQVNLDRQFIFLMT